MNPGKFILAAAIAALFVAPCSSLPGAEDIPAADTTVALKTFSEASQSLYKKISASLVKVRIDQNLNSVLPASLEKEFREWRDRTMHMRPNFNFPESQTPDQLSPDTVDAPATVIIHPKDDDHADAPASTSASFPSSAAPASSSPATAPAPRPRRQENLRGLPGPMGRGGQGGPGSFGMMPGANANQAAMMRREWNAMLIMRFLQERRNDPDSLLRARFIGQRLDAIRNGQGSEIIGVIYDSQGHILVPTVLLLDVGNRGKTTVSLTLPDGTDATAKVLGSDAMRGDSILQLDTTAPAQTPLAAAKPDPGELLLDVSANTGAVSWTVAPIGGMLQSRRSANVEERFAITTSEEHSLSFLFNVSGQLTALGFDHYALPMDTLAPEIKELTDNGFIHRRQFGVRWAEVTDEDRAQNPKLADHPAIRVEDVIPNSPAEKAGLKKGDYILTVDKAPISRLLLPRILRDLAAKTGPVPIGILRDGTEQTLQVPLEK